MASKEITSSDNNVFLKCPEDWESWDLQFQGQAVSKRLWDQILGIKAFLTEPTAPDISSFQRQGTTRPATRSQSTVDNEEIGSHMSISFANLPPESQKLISLSTTFIWKKERGTKHSLHQLISSKNGHGKRSSQITSKPVADLPKPSHSGTRS
jgi:hypothetical protein